MTALPMPLTLALAVAAAVWLYALWQAARVVRAVRPGQRASLFFPGWPWNVRKAVGRYGPQVEAPLRAFQHAFFIFFLVIFVAMAAAMFAIAKPAV